MATSPNIFNDTCNDQNPNTTMTEIDPKVQKRGRVKLLMVLAVCAAPVIMSYITYYIIKPQSRTNYGTLIEPQRPAPALQLRELDGRPFEIASLQGKWLMLTVDESACAQSCEDKLYHMRQVRLTTGKERDRVERLWLVPDEAPLATTLIRQYDGMHFLRADPRQLAEWLPLEASGQLADHIYMVDPRGNLMMRFPKDADPTGTRKDLSKLLRASRTR